MSYVFQNFHLNKLIRYFIFKAKTCPNNMTYVECASNCPKACHSLTQTISDSDTCMSDCSPGCICSNGTVLDLGQNQQCVQPNQCTCYYRGIYYQPGNNITIDCNDW